jgi:hypothetical protein
MFSDDEPRPVSHLTTMLTFSWRASTDNWPGLVGWLTAVGCVPFAFTPNGNLTGGNGAGQGRFDRTWSTGD